MISDPYKNIKFVEKRCTIKNEKNEIIFDEYIEFPEDFDDNAAAIVASRYLCNNAKHKETSIKDMFDRVSETIAEWGLIDGYFESNLEKEEFGNKLKYYQIHRYFAFNSPAYFNVGLKENPQSSACFILKIDDNMESIFEVGKQESLIFKQGSGCGTNLSTLRSSKETVSAGGLASGPVSFLKAHDVSAGVIKSGGTLRRSAKLARLDITHPDIINFIDCKLYEEEKLRILKQAGLKPRPGYDLSDEVFYQNTNLSIGVTDDFMNAVLQDESFATISIIDKTPFEEFKAREILKKIAENSWKIADPALQFSDTINRWNTCSNVGRINSSNPCGEFLSVDNSSCNLASLNLLAFFKKVNGTITFDHISFEDVIRSVITAQDILINRSSYPNREISTNSMELRPLGLGYTNLGALLMYLGLPYDSEEGRKIAAGLTALMTGIAYIQSNKLARNLGSYEKFDPACFFKVLNKHYEMVRFRLIEPTFNPKTEETTIDVDPFGILENVKQIWKTLEQKITTYFLVGSNTSNPDLAFRNSQVTLLAPTGTISSIMNAVTTGIEPEYSLVRYKRLAGSEGATLKYVNPIVEESLRNLGYEDDIIPKIIKEELIEVDAFDSPSYFKNVKDRQVFFTAAPTPGTQLCISYMGHVKMVAAVQPFVSGGISKTVNLPQNTTVEEIYKLYITAWQLGLKGITVYRDGSKEFQPLSTSDSKKVEESPVETKKVEILVEKKRLPKKRPGIIQKFEIAGTEGYLICGVYPDTGKLGEIFIEISTEGSTLSGFADAIATVVSISLQYGVPLKDFVKKLSYLKFEPHGFTTDPNIRTANSIIDYIFRYLGYEYLQPSERKDLGLLTPEELKESINPYTSAKHLEVKNYNSGPTCPNCGSLMRRLGSCHFCDKCAYNTGSCG